MNKLIKAFCLVVVLSVCSFTQGTDKYKKSKVLVGYSKQQINAVNRQYIKWL
jgi:hypothetical protein